jgi:hypothetical protein
MLCPYKENTDLCIRYDTKELPPEGTSNAFVFFKRILGQVAPGCVEKFELRALQLSRLFAS